MLAFVMAAGCSQLPSDDPPHGNVYDATTIELDALAVAPETANVAYDRQAWGGWSSRPGECSTRVVILKRDGHDWQVDRCKLSCPIAACWTSTYDGVVTALPSKLQIDHLVPVHEAVQSGAAAWDMNERVQFYNDEINLTAVSVHANESKGDRDPGEWLPTNVDYRCAYVQRYVDVKYRYRLTVDVRERDALIRVLDTCTT